MIHMHPIRINIDNFQCEATNVKNKIKIKEKPKGNRVCLTTQENEHKFEIVFRMNIIENAKLGRTRQSKAATSITAGDENKANEHFETVYSAYSTR